MGGAFFLRSLLQHVDSVTQILKSDYTNENKK